MCRSVPQIPAWVIAISTSRGPIAGIGVSGDQVSPGWGLVFLMASMVCTRKPCALLGVRASARMRVRDMLAEARTPIGGLICVIAVLLHIERLFDIIDGRSFAL